MIGRPKKYLTEEDKRLARKLWYLNNKEKVIKKNKNWRSKNKDKVKIFTNEWKKNNKDKVKESRKKTYIKYKEKNLLASKEHYEINKNKRLVQVKEWSRHNKNKCLLINKNYYNKNRNTKIEKGKEWRKNNNDLVKVYSSQRRQRKRDIGEGINKNLYKQVYFKFNNKCYICKSKNNLALDHHYPLSLGNPLTINNAVLLCQSCNSSKSNKLPESFYSPEQLTDLQDNYGITKQPQKIEEQPSLFEARMPKNLERDNGLFEAMNAA